MDLLVIFVVAIIFLAIIGLGWNTFIEGVWRGADKVGIASIIGNVTQSATDIATKGI